MEPLWDIILTSDAPILAAFLIYVWRQKEYWKGRSRQQADELDTFRTEQLQKWQGMYEAANSALTMGRQAASTMEPKGRSDA